MLFIQSTAIQHNIHLLPVANFIQSLIESKMLDQIHFLQIELLLSKKAVSHINELDMVKCLMNLWLVSWIATFRCNGYNLTLGNLIRVLLRMFDRIRMEMASKYNIPMNLINLSESMQQCVYGGALVVINFYDQNTC